MVRYRVCDVVVVGDGIVWSYHLRKWFQKQFLKQYRMSCLCLVGEC